MTDLTFQFRLSCLHEGIANNIDQLLVEHLVDDNWRILNLNIKSPGFDIFLYSLLNCQHTYFRINAAERNLLLQSSQGQLTITTDRSREIKSISIDFKGVLKSGIATENSIEYIKQRMSLCPVSINLKNIESNTSSVSFIS